MYCGFCICPGRQKLKTQSCFWCLWNYCLRISLLGIRVYFCECVWERKRERGTTQVFWRRQAIGFLDSQGSSRVRTHLSGPLTSQATSFSLWIPWLLPRSSDQFYPVYKHPTAYSVLKSHPNSTLTTCVPSARTLLSTSQFPHMSHELIRVTSVWGCFRIKLVISGKWWE